MLNSIGITDILIVTGFSSHRIEQHVFNKNVRCIYNPFWNHCNVLGSLFMALPYIDDDFVFLHADTLADKEIWLNLVRHNGGMVLPYKVKECGEEEMKIRINEQNILLEINKTMNPAQAVGEFIGIAKFSKDNISFFQESSKKLFCSGDLNQYMEEVIQVAINENLNISLQDIKDSDFIEVDFQEDYEDAIKIFSNKFDDFEI